ncbi:MAG: polyphosphate kinase 2 [Myxococcota bacterium]
MAKKRSRDDGYERRLRRLQIELVKLQRHVIEHGHKLLVIVEGRDAAGKDGIIKRVVEHLSPRETRVVALGKPSDRDERSWYFQRFIPHLPSAQELVLFNRSWYSRAGVERVMGFCTEPDVARFFKAVIPFEQMLVDAGIQMLKYYLDISKAEQRRRLEERRTDPLKQWKSSPVDQVALRRWNAYSRARDEMLARTHNAVTPWFIVRADDKRAARLNVIRHVLSRVDCPEKDEHEASPDERIVFPYDERCASRGWLAV